MSTEEVGQHSSIEADNVFHYRSQKKRYCHILICEYRISLIKFNISPSRIVFDKLVSFAPGTSRCAAFGSVRRDASKIKLGDHS